MGKRIIRGFHRIGIGAAVLVALAGAGLTAAITREEYSRHANEIEIQAPNGSIVSFPEGTTIATIDRAMTELFGAGAAVPPCRPGYGKDCTPWERDWPHIHSPTATAAESASIGLGITAVLALVAWGFFRGLGWIVAGFARD